MASFSKFIRPETPRRGFVSDRDLDIIAAILRQRFVSAAQLVRLVGGNEDVTHRRLRRLWESGLVNRWAFPGFRTHSEFYYYLDSRVSLDLLIERRGVALPPQVYEEVRSNREKDYAGAAFRGEHMKLGFLNHSLLISRMHYMLEMASRQSAGQVELVDWRQGGQLSGHKVEVPKVRSSRRGGQYFWEESELTERLPVEPDGLFTLRFPERPPGGQLVHYAYEADRGSMNTTDMLKKLRAYYHFIKKQQRHKQAFGRHPIRAVLFETNSERRGRTLMQLVNHPLVCGPTKRSGLFWFTISPLFGDPSPGQNIPTHLVRPEVVLDQIWALPDLLMYSLCDHED